MIRSLLGRFRRRPHRSLTFEEIKARRDREFRERLRRSQDPLP